MAATAGDDVSSNKLDKLQVKNSNFRFLKTGTKKWTSATKVL